MTFSVLDLVFLIIILSFAVIALIKGFVSELFGKGAPVLSVWIAILTYKLLLPSLECAIKIHILAVIVSFLIIFFVCYLILMIVKSILKKLVDNEILGGLNKFLGFVFGIIEGLALVLIILLLLSSQPWFDVSSLLEGSVFYRIFSPLLISSAQTISGAVNSAASGITDGIFSSQSSQSPIPAEGGI